MNNLGKCMINYTVNGYPMELSTFTTEYALAECYELLLTPEVTFIQLYRIDANGNIDWYFILKDTLRIFYEPEKSYI